LCEDADRHPVLAKHNDARAQGQSAGRHGGCKTDTALRTLAHCRLQKALIADSRPIKGVIVGRRRHIVKPKGRPRRPQGL